MNGNYPIEKFLSTEEVDVLKRTLLSGFTEAEQEAFIRLCQRTLLDPFSKQIYATRRYTKGNPVLVPVTSVIGLTAVAARTGHYDGCIITWAGKDGVWRDEWLEDEPPSAAKCVVFHKERSHPEIGIARWNGYCGQAYNKETKRWEVTDFWDRLPDFMLGKCSKAQALRGAFPDQLSNLYISEELQGNISEADQINDEVKITENRKKEEELLKQAAAKGIKIVESKPVKKPTPAEAAAPAPEPPTPPKPKEEPPAPTSPEPAPQPEPAPVPTTEQQPDDLDMSPSEPRAEGPPAESAKPWADHVIRGLKNPKFFERKVGELSIAELQAIEAQWLPKVRQVWDQVNSLQKADAEAFEAALAFSKMEKPWG
jgi:phage recombination protein Bet